MGTRLRRRASRRWGGGSSGRLQRGASQGRRQTERLDFFAILKAEQPGHEGALQLISALGG
jgi:hypothetical protein